MCIKKLKYIFFNSFILLNLSYNSKRMISSCEIEERVLLERDIH
jgi:hypothetical protein